MLTPLRAAHVASRIDQHPPAVTQGGSLLRLPRADFDALVMTRPTVLKLVSQLAEDRAERLDGILRLQMWAAPAYRAPDRKNPDVLGADQAVVEVVARLGHEPAAVFLAAHHLVDASEVRGAANLVESSAQLLVE